MTLNGLPESPCVSSELTDLKVANLIEIYNQGVPDYSSPSTDLPSADHRVSALFLAQPGRWD